MRAAMTLTTLIALPSALLAGPSVALADEQSVEGTPDLVCSQEHEGAPNSMLYAPGTTVNGGMVCGYTDALETVIVGKWKTFTWTSTAPAGWDALTACTDRTGVEIADGSLKAQSTGTVLSVTGYGYANPREFAVEVLWSAAVKNSEKAPLGSQFIGHEKSTDYCAGSWGSVDAAVQYPVGMTLVGDDVAVVATDSTFDVSVDGAAYGGVAPATGTVQLMVDTSGSLETDLMLASATLSDGRATLTTDFTYLDATGRTIYLTPGTYPVYAAYSGTASAEPILPSSGWAAEHTGSIDVTVGAAGTASLAGTATEAGSSGEQASVAVMASSSPKPDVSLAQDETSTGGRLTALCPTGEVPTKVNLLSSSTNVDFGDVSIRTSRRAGATVDAPAGSFTTLQAVCRPLAAGVVTLADATYGSAGADRVVTRPRGTSRVLYAGIGRDTIRLRANNSYGYGGMGADDITARAKGAVADGGFGNDTLRANTDQWTLLIGGPGKDTLIGGRGATVINAQDGRPGDVITCRSSRNEVYADPGDVIEGPCTLR